MIVSFAAHYDVFAKKHGTHFHPFTNSIPHSGQAGFLKIRPTFGQQSAQNIFLHLGHCHAVGFKNPPMGLPQTEQNPLTTASTVVTVCSYGILRVMVEFRERECVKQGLCEEFKTYFVRNTLSSINDDLKMGCKWMIY